MSWVSHQVGRAVGTSGGKPGAFERIENHLIPREYAKLIPKEMHGQSYWNAQKFNAATKAAQQAGQDTMDWPSFNFEWPEISFEPVMIDFMAEYEKIRTQNEGLVNRYSAESATTAKQLSKDFTETNLLNFETAMERIQPGYKGLLSKTSAVVNDWLFGRVPDDVQNQLMIQASSRANQSGIGAGGFARNLLARDFGQTSLDLQKAGVGEAQQLVNAARQTSRSLIADPAPLYGANLSAKINSTILQPGQYLQQLAQQAQFNSSGQFNASAANATGQANMAMAQYQDELNRYAAQQQANAANTAKNRPSGVFGKYFGNDIGSILDPVAQIAVPLIANYYFPGSGAAAGAALGYLNADATGGDKTTGAIFGAGTGYMATNQWGNSFNNWYGNLSFNQAATGTATNSYGVLASGYSPYAQSATPYTNWNMGAQKPVLEFGTGASAPSQGWGYEGIPR